MTVHWQGAVGVEPVAVGPSAEPAHDADGGDGLRLRGGQGQGLPQLGRRARSDL